MVGMTLGHSCAISMGFLGDDGASEQLVWLVGWTRDGVIDGPSRCYLLTTTATACLGIPVCLHIAWHSIA